MLGEGGVDAALHHHHHRGVATSFVVDCSYRSYNALTPDCRRLREMFYGRETVGGDLHCDEPPQVPEPGHPNKYPVSREVVIHDTQIDMWYKCCEHRHRWSKFMTDAEYPRLPKKMGMDMLPIALPFGKKKPGVITPPPMPDGPLLQCQMHQPMKHSQNLNTGGRKIMDEIPNRLIPGMATRCGGDEAIALEKWAPGRISLADFGFGAEAGSCVDLGPYNRATSQGKPYAVYELSSAPVLGPLAIVGSPYDLHRSIGAAARARRRVATATFL